MTLARVIASILFMLTVMAMMLIRDCQKERADWQIKCGDALVRQAQDLERDQYPDTEADGVVFCGKCGKRK